MNKRDFDEVSLKTKEWKAKLGRSLSLKELNQLKKDLDPIMVMFFRSMLLVYIIKMMK